MQVDIILNYLGIYIYIYIFAYIYIYKCLPRTLTGSQITFHFAPFKVAGTRSVPDIQRSGMLEC